MYGMLDKTVYNPLRAALDYVKIHFGESKGDLDVRVDVGVIGDEGNITRETYTLLALDNKHLKSFAECRRKKLE